VNIKLCDRMSYNKSQRPLPRCSWYKHFNCYGGLEICADETNSECDFKVGAFIITAQDASRLQETAKEVSL